MIDAIIIDDEEPARNLIRHYLQDYLEVKIVNEAANGFDAMKMIKDQQPQLIFLDIQIPKLTGFEMLELIDTPPEIIFSTAYDQFAIKAFERNAIDYLLKPFSKQRFDTALQKVFAKISQGKENVQDVQPTKKVIDYRPETLTRIAVKDRQEIHVIHIQDIDYLEAAGDYVKIHTPKGSFLKEKTMKYFEDNLPSRQFIRIHRSFIVNVDEVVKIELLDKEVYWVHLKNKMILKASSAGYKALKDAVRL